MNPGIKETIQARFDALRKEALKRQDAFQRSPAPKIHIGMATCGIAAGALETKAAFEQTLKERNIEAHVHTVGCLGHCYAEPVVIIEHPDSGFPPIFYHEVTAGKAKMLAKMFIEGGDPRFEHVYGATEVNDMIPSVMEFSRFSLEKRVIMDKCGKIDPDDIFEYIALGGYAALVRALQMSPGEIVDEIKRSGLRGRGGAGFPTGVKWEMASHADHEDKIVICNADEGDPGAYMDRTLLESNPHQILEGMMICALAVGAGQAMFYVRAEYPLAVKTIARAIRQAGELNLLGEGILGSAFDLHG